jgi:hypothetical protein
MPQKPRMQTWNYSTPLNTLPEVIILNVVTGILKNCVLKETTWIFKDIYYKI